jgi:perosamine synthetase
VGASVSFIPLAQPDISEKEKAYVIEAIDSGFLTHRGRFEQDFERAFSEHFGVRSLATSSGTGALHLALLALGVGRGDEIIVPDLTFGATASVVLACGATPVLIDVDPETWGIDKKKIAKYLTKRTRAIIPVHLYGEDAGDYSEFGVPVVEDSCEALGYVPMRGTMTCFSFYGNKVMTTGEGGMLCGDFGNARDWRDGGFDSDYSNTIPGLNYRMTNLQAAVGLAQIERLPELLSRRERALSIYRENLKGRGKWLFVTETKNAASAIPRLKSEGIDCRPVFKPLHLCPAFRHLAKGKYPHSELIWMTGVCLPTGTHVSEEQAQYVVGRVKECH